MTDADRREMAAQLDALISDVPTWAQHLLRLFFNPTTS